MVQYDGLNLRFNQTIGTEHDNTLSGDGTTANPLGVVESALPYNETVLWTGASNLSANPTFNLNEPATAFNYIEFQFVPFNDNMRSTICQKFVQDNKEYDVNGIGFNGVSGLRFEKARLKYSNAQATAVNTTDSIEWTIDKNSYTWTTCKACMYKIVGIGRKEI